MLTLYLTFVTVWIAYNIAIYMRYGLLTSVSASHYALINENKKLGWVFTIFSWGYALPAIMMATTGLMFFAGAFICFVGVAANYKDDGLDGIWHGRFAMIAVGLSQLSIAFDYGLYWLNIASLLVAVVLWCFKDKIKFTYWVEQVAWLAIAYTLTHQL